MRVGLTTAIATAIAIGVLVASNGGGGACSWPSCFPDASNTGVPAGTSLTAYTGPNPITADDTTLTGKIFEGADCPLTIQAINITISDSQFNCTDNVIYVDDAGMYAETSNGTQFAVTVEDSNLSCGDTKKTALLESYIHAIRVEMTDCENGVYINQKVTVEESYIHDLYSEPIDPHEDGGQLSDGHWTGSAYSCPSQGAANPCAINATFYHNTIFGMTTQDTVFGTSAIISNHDGNIDENILIEKNLLAGGAYTLYCDRPEAGTNYVVKDNHFSTQFDADVGFFGPSDDCADETLSGNVYHETGLPITLG